MMDPREIRRLGDELYQALRTFSTLTPLTERESEITIEDAYHISLRMLERRQQADGEKVVDRAHRVGE